jgi:hypothetical protein
MGKQLVNFIICDCESNAPFFVIYKAGREPPASSTTKTGRHDIAESGVKHQKSIKHIRGHLFEDAKFVFLSAHVINTTPELLCLTVLITYFPYL